MGAIEAAYRQRTRRSAELAQWARRVMPGGDTRSSAHHPPYTLTIERGEGAHLWDVDGQGYVDLLGNFTSLVHGNAHPPIVEAAARQVARGTQWPARNEAQVELAELLVERVASVEQVRFTNSGTEATMLALQIARAVTGRRLVLMARHGYHGSLEDFEVGTLGHEGPSTLLADHGDAASFEVVLEARGREVAAVVLEPVMGASGVVASPPGFLARVADAARRAGAVFVLDEVITLRLATGGAQSLEGVAPDLTAMGKIIGGGFPIGAVGGRADLMAVLDPEAGRLAHSGTFNGNPVSCAAGAVSLRQLSSDRIGVMAAQAAALQAGLEQAAARAGLPFCCRRAGSLLQCYLSEVPPPTGPQRADADQMGRFHLAALNHGLFFAGRGLLALSTAFDDDLVAEVLERAGAALADVAAEA